jgi:hypothetical protein
VPVELESWEHEGHPDHLLVEVKAVDRQSEP